MDLLRSFISLFNRSGETTVSVTSIDLSIPVCYYGHTYVAQPNSDELRRATFILESRNKNAGKTFTWLLSCYEEVTLLLQDDSRRTVRKFEIRKIVVSCVDAKNQRLLAIFFDNDSSESSMGMECHLFLCRTKMVAKLAANKIGEKLNKLQSSPPELQPKIKLEQYNIISRPNVVSDFDYENISRFFREEVFNLSVQNPSSESSSTYLTAGCDSGRASTVASVDTRSEETSRENPIIENVELEPEVNIIEPCNNNNSGVMHEKNNTRVSMHENNNKDTKSITNNIETTPSTRKRTNSHNKNTKSLNSHNKNTSSLNSHNKNTTSLIGGNDSPVSVRGCGRSSSFGNTGKRPSIKNRYSEQYELMGNKTSHKVNDIKIDDKNSTKCSNDKNCNQYEVMGTDKQSDTKTSDSRQDEKINFVISIQPQNATDNSDNESGIDIETKSDTNSEKIEENNTTGTNSININITPISQNIQNRYSVHYDLQDELSLSEGEEDVFTTNGGVEDAGKREIRTLDIERSPDLFLRRIDKRELHRLTYLSATDI